MLNGKDHKAAARGVFMSSIEWLANIGAVVVTFFATPIVYGFTIGWVTRFTQHYYGDAFLDVVTFVWGGIVMLLLGCIARMSIGTVLVLGGLIFATRFL